ncbi:MAG: thymidine kinase [Microthrixaceae bacterium]|nr:thymidine kinase [Microthrixaceae bacterium]MCB9387739.1 thymidine kinase [Microthrixaceae bacterium]MCO5319811.1 thymidine kinase [Microthrixaceae bacterium]
MALLRFFGGTMGSGKSTLALQIHHNLSRTGLDGVLVSRLDREGSVVSSRLGVSAEALEAGPEVDLEKLVVSRGGLDYLVCDEAQFLEPEQVEQLARAVDDHGVDVWAFGLLTSFQGRLFPGTARLMELADERQDLQVEARCWCGERATHNARLVDGVFTLEGELHMVGDTGDPEDHQERFALETPRVTYELLCRRHWLAGEPTSPPA